MDNRFIFLGGLILGVIACMIMADWQALGGDPCDKFSGYCENRNVSTFDFYIEENNAGNTSTLSPCEVCKMHSGDPYQCFFNPDSRITHEYCNDCRPFCRSELHSLNFAQFLIGVCLFSFSFPLVRITMTIMFSDALGSASQVMVAVLVFFLYMYCLQSLMQGLLICSEAIARATAPVWGECMF